MDLMRRPSSTSSSRIIVRVIVGFLVLVIPIMSVVHLLWYPKDFMYNFYSLDNSEFDVEFFGSSHCFCSVNPAILYEDYGMTSYNLAGTAQFMPQTYYYLKEAIKRNKPKVAAIEVYAVYADSSNSDFVNSSNTNLQSMLPSVNKAKALLDCDAEFPLARFFNYAMSHGGFTSLSARDYQLTHGYDKNMGYIGYDRTYAHDQFAVSRKDYEGIVLEIPSETEGYLRECIKLCLENDVEPILFCAPYPSASEFALQRYNYVQRIADEYGIVFCNAFDDLNKLKLDFSCDFEDKAGHLNYYGAEKFTKYFGEWLANNVRTELIDHRVSDGADEAMWKDVVGNWHSIKLRCQLDKADTLDEYQRVLINSDADYIVLDDDYETALLELLNRLSAKEKNNILHQTASLFRKMQQDVEDDSIYFFVYNKYDIEEVSVRAFSKQ